MNKGIYRMAATGLLTLALAGCGASMNQSPGALGGGHFGGLPTANGQGSEAGFQTWVASFRPRALAAGISPQVFDGAMGQAHFMPSLIALDRKQSEFSKPIWDYLDGAIGTRVGTGRSKAAQYASTLAAIEARYGVPREIVLAVWGMESNFGAGRGSTPIVPALATLAYDGRRGEFFAGELVAALRIIQAGDVDSAHMVGSWAGAMGHTQFMPSVYQREAVDFDGDGRRDIWTSVPDALASTANYLRSHGWRPGEGWGAEAVLPETFDAALADETTVRTVAAWRGLGVRPARDRALPDTAEATLILPAGIRGPAFLLQPNFAVILRYNTALAYALTVALLSDRLRGDPGLVHDWPRGDRPLTADERRDLQTRLTERGFATGGVDGKIGPKTRAALRAFQGSVGLPPDGYADAALLDRVRAAP